MATIQPSAERSYPIQGLVGMGMFVLVLPLGLEAALRPLHATRLVIEAAYQILLLLALWFFATHDGLGLGSLNPGAKWNRRDGLLILALVVVVYLGNGTYLYLMRDALPKQTAWWDELISNLKALSPVAFGMVGIGGAIVVGFAEELVFRSYLITRLRKSGLGPWPSILLSSVAFGLIHLPADGLIRSAGTAVFWGIPTGYFFYRRGSILPLIAAHSFVDALAFTLIYIFEVS
jgi:membrane protease YdiL (CAAX protease family)